MAGEPCSAPPRFYGKEQVSFHDFVVLSNGDTYSEYSLEESEQLFLVLESKVIL